MSVIFDVKNYNFLREGDVDLDFFPKKDWYDQFLKQGMRTSVYGILVVHVNREPHLLVLRHHDSGMYCSFGGPCKYGEDPMDSMKRLLSLYVKPREDAIFELKISQHLSTLYRPSYDLMLFPFSPKTVLRPKEKILVFLCELPDRAMINIPDAYDIKSIPLVDFLADEFYSTIFQGVVTSLSKISLQAMEVNPNAL